MHFHVITLFPEMIEQMCEFGVLGRAIKRGIIKLSCWNPRDYTQDRHRTVDDRPYGGGPGMLMKVQPLADAITAAKQQAGEDAKVIYLSPQGRILNQQAVINMADRPEQKELILIAGRYEGIDERLIKQYVDEEWSIGDYVLSGGEMPALILIDAVARMLPDVLGDADSAQQDSFMEGLLDCPHYTRPEEVNGQMVPEVLLSGDHKKIDRWRKKQALERTWLRRPDLLGSLQLNEEQRKWLSEFQQEHDQSKH
ncbi:MAG: tRNA (guanosine(37)-N1)-methyltransferase TrmD [Gammaproteobacteria bacterium]|nr:tRNA (guanosine(37)-N1)-methyltransferase TrmD [Gammaproteobacteria bacterium]